MRWLMLSLLVGVVMGHWPERQERNPPTRCIPPNHCFPSRQVIAEFAANITGNVYQPSDAEYAALVTSANERLTHHPAIVVVVATESDVQKAVMFARKYHLMLTVASENGDFTRGSYADAALQINLSKLKAISTNIDLQATTADPGTVTAEAGVTWPELSAAVAAVNRVVIGAGASVHPIGEGTQGGGTGVLSRSLGLAADNLLSARMVTMGGSVVEVSENGETMYLYNGISRYTTLDPGLWRALRGGGAGSYGIVVSYTFRMHIPTSYVTQVSASYVLYENDQFVGREPLKFLLPAVYSLPSQWGGYVMLTGLTSSTTVGQKGLLNLELVHYGDYNSVSYNAISDILNYDGNGARLSVSVVNRTNVDSFTRNIVFNVPDYSRTYGFNTLLPPSVLENSDVLDKFVDVLLLLLNDPAVDAHYVCSLEPLGGAISTINSTAYVTDALRNAAMSVTCALRWNDPDAIRDEMFVAYAMGMAQGIKAFGSGTPLTVGFFEDEEDWKQNLYGDNYNELLRVKTKYDVDNYLWCHNCVGSDFRPDCRHGCDKARRQMRLQLLDRVREENNRRMVQFMSRDED